MLVSRFHHSVAQMLYIMGGGLLLVLAANLIYIALAPQKEKQRYKTSSPIRGSFLLFMGPDIAQFFA